MSELEFDRSIPEEPLNDTAAREAGQAQEAAAEEPFSPVTDYPPVSEAYRTENLHSAASAPNTEAAYTEEAPRQEAPRQTVRPDQSWQTPRTQTPPQKQVKVKKSGGFGKKAVALALVCALLGGLTGAGGAWLVWVC